MGFDAQTALTLTEIVWINLLLSGDNAVVIALACRGLPITQRKWGIILGTVPAVALRILFALFVIYLMKVRYLKLAGGLLLLWIAVKLLQPERHTPGQHRKAASLSGAVRTIVVADVIMSLDNVVALAAAAQGRFSLLVVGLAISMPLVILGSALLLKLLTRFPVFVTAGGGLLGFIAGQTAVSDAAFADGLEQAHPLWSLLVPIACAIGTVVAGRGLAYLAAHRECKSPPET
jgi:YjbE family integral membrane protein